MRSQTLGTDTSIVEVTHIDSHGFWLFVDGTERFLSYEDFPWFHHATVSQITHVERSFGNHFHWPDLDVDLTLEMIDSPQKFPLKHA